MLQTNIPQLHCNNNHINYITIYADGDKGITEIIIGSVIGNSRINSSNSSNCIMDSGKVNIHFTY